MIAKLEMFITLARTRHFGRAAEEVGVTQPTLSAAIRQLEDTLGTLLVRRGSRFEGLSDEGERVLVWARKIVADTRTMREEIMAAKGGLSGTVRLAVIPTALAASAQLTSQLSRNHPNIRISIRAATSVQILEQLADHSVDAGLTYLDNEPLGQVRTVSLYSERYVLLTNGDAGGKYGLGQTVSWADLADLPLCLLTPDMQNRRIIDRHLADALVIDAPRVESNSTIALVSHVLTGGWATILPEQAVAPFIQSGPLVATPIVAPDIRQNVGLVVAPRETQRPVIAALLQEARRIAARYKAEA